MSFLAPLVRSALRGKRILGGALAFAACAFLLAGPPLSSEAGSLRVHATTPSLGSADSFAVLASTYTNTVGGTVLNGDLGYTTGPAVAPTVNGTTFSPPSAKYTAAGADQGTALGNLNGQSCDFTFVGGAVDLATDATHGPIGVYTPGVYCYPAAASIGAGGITLNGAGTYLFRIAGALTTVANSTVTLAGGASACNVFWTPSGATTLGANSTFRGTNIDPAGITVGNAVVWEGRALAFGGTVTTASDTITASGCVAPATATPVPTATSAAVAAATNAAVAATSAAAPAPGLASNDGGNEPATAVPAATRTATATATRTATSVPTTIPATATLPAATPVPAPIPAIIVAPVVVAEIPIAPLTPIVVVAIPETAVLDEGIIELPAGTVIEAPDIGLVVVDVPIPVEIPVLVPALAPVAPQPQVPATATPRPAPLSPPAVVFPRTGTGPAPVLLPETGAPAVQAVQSFEGLVLAAGALALGGAAFRRRRRTR